MKKSKEEGGILLFGVDKHNVGSFFISRTHDFEKLFSHDNIKTNTRPGSKKIKLYDENTGEAFEFQCVTINKDERFETLHLGVKKVGNGLKEYATLKVFIEDEDNEEGTANLFPLKQSEVLEKQTELLLYIREKYGLNLECDKSKYTFMEINKTVELKEDVKEYHDVMEYMKLVAPAKYRRRTEDTDKYNEINLISLQNNSVKIKVYNKTKQLKEYKSIEVDKFYMRIEICLKDSRKIQNAFGTTIIEEITDEMMLEYYLRTIKADIFDRVESQIEKSKPFLKKELKAQKEDDAKKYPKMFLISVCSLYYKKTKIPLLFDFEQCFEVLKKDVARWDRTYKTLLKEIDKRPDKKNNLMKYHEIKNKILNSEK